MLPPGGTMAKRGRRKRVEGGPDEESARDVGRQRMVYRAGNSWVVAVPLWARRALDRVEGGLVYWHDVRAHEVVLSNTPRRAAGHPHGAAMQKTIDRLRRETVLLRRQLRARPLATLHEGKAVGWAEASKYYLKIEADLEVIRDEVRELAARMPFRRRRGRLRGVATGADVAVSEPRPDLPLPVDVSSGGAAASEGEALQAAHT